MKNPILVSLLLTLSPIAICCLWAQDHGHLNAGARSREQNGQLFFANGNDFSASSDYVKTLTFTNAGRFAGYYEGNITLTVLPATAPFNGPDPNAPALGAYVRFRVSCLEGPPGGSFAFWETGATAPSISMSPGQAVTNLWPVTQSDGSPGSDPYGHIHGRRFTATKPGLYKAAFRLFDTSVNGSSGGPIHTPSLELPVWFQAGFNFASITRSNQITNLRFGARAHWRFTVECADSLIEPLSWFSLGEPISGTDYFKTVADPASTASQRYYRLRAVPE